MLSESKKNSNGQHVT